MKTFHYAHGRPARTTLTVGELQALLAQYPADMPVLAEWEGQRMPLGLHHEVERYSAGVDEERCDCLVLDAENDQHAHPKLVDSSQSPL